MEKTIEELKQEAADLGIKHSPNIGAAKLAQMIEDHYTAQETSVMDPALNKVDEPEVNTGRSMRARIDAAKAAAKKTHIVTITDNDQRENNHTTTVTVNCSNNYFDLGTKVLPLNTPIELEQGFISVLKEIMIPMHVQGANGLTKTVLRARYSLQNDDQLRQ